MTIKLTINELMHIINDVLDNVEADCCGFIPAIDTIQQHKFVGSTATHPSSMPGVLDIDELISNYKVEVVD